MRYFKRANESPRIVRIYRFCAPGVFFSQEGVQRCSTFLPEKCSEPRIRRGIGECDATRKRIGIKSRSARDYGERSAFRYIRDGLFAETDEILCGERSFRRRDVKEMVSYAAHFLFRYFARSKVQSSIYLAGIGGYDLASETAREPDGERAFTGSGGPDDDQYFLLHEGTVQWEAMERQPDMKVYYDGTCNLCIAAIGAVSRSSAGASVASVDVTKGELPPGVSLEAAMRDVHVVGTDGSVRKGAEAVLAIIERYPAWRWAALLGRLPLLRQCAQGMYRVVAGTRYWIFGRVV